MSASPAFQTALGLAVKARREELKLTQEAVSLRADLHQRWVSNVENGKRNPSYGSPRRLAAELSKRGGHEVSRDEAVEGDIIQLNGPNGNYYYEDMHTAVVVSHTVARKHLRSWIPTTNGTKSSASTRGTPTLSRNATA